MSTSQQQHLLQDIHNLLQHPQHASTASGTTAAHHPPPQQQQPLKPSPPQQHRHQPDTSMAAPGPPAVTSAAAPTSTQDLLPVFDLSAFIALPPTEAPSPELVQQCAALAACLEATGCLVVRDPRVTSADNDAFIDLLEAYFGRPAAAKAADARPALAYQVGATPEGVEVPRCVAEPEACAAALAVLPPGNAPVLPTGPDAKERFFWRIGSRPSTTAFPELNAPPVVPEGMPGWVATMDGWGGQLLAAVTAVAGMAALGWGLDRDAFVSRMRGGPHLLAPTGSDLSKHGALGAVLAGWHYDLNFLTIHGRSRFPGLFVWLADGTRSPVAIPPGCLLVQAGKQLEHLTGGRVRAGMHEVVVTEGTLAAVAAARAAGRSAWRVSSTLFAHIASDVVLQPLVLPAASVTPPQQQQQDSNADANAAAAAATHYAPIPAGLQVQRELEAIQLMKGAAASS